MNKIWRIRKFGKLKVILYYYIVLFANIVLFIYSLSGWGETPFIVVMVRTLVFGIIPVLIMLIFPPLWIMRKGIATSVELDFERRLLFVKVNNRDIVPYSLSNMSYSFRKETFYSVLVFYETNVSPHTGNVYYKELFQVLGNAFHILWRLNDVFDIVSELQRLNIPDRNDDGRPLIDYVT